MTSDINTLIIMKISFEEMCRDLAAYNSIPVLEPVPSTCTGTELRSFSHDAMEVDAPFTEMELHELAVLLDVVDMDEDTNLMLSIQIFQRELKNVGHRKMTKLLEKLPNCNSKWSIFVGKLLYEFPLMYAKKHLHDFIEYVEEINTTKIDVKNETFKSLQAIAKIVNV